MKQFIVLEGCDAAGKTTVGEMIAKTSGGVYVKTPSLEYKGLRDRIDRNNSYETRLLFYLTSVSDASDKIREIRQTQHVICDRYIWSSFVGYSAYSQVSIDGVVELSHGITGHIEMPDQVILLKVNEEEQLQRIMERSEKGSVSDAECLVNGEFRRTINRLYEEIAERYKWHVIDTTGRKVKDVAEEIREEFLNTGRICRDYGSRNQGKG